MPQESNNITGAAGLARGVTRLLGALGYGTLAEFVLGSGRRADVFGMTARAEIAIVEIKMSVADFRADGKWPDYEAYCDRFYFAVAADFPTRLLPADRGLIIADPYGAAIVRDAPRLTLAPSRRRALVLDFGLQASLRLARLVDPMAG
jgi:hypothetical protein